MGCLGFLMGFHGDCMSFFNGDFIWIEYDNQQFATVAPTYCRSMDELIMDSGEIYWFWYVSVAETFETSEQWKWSRSCEFYGI